MEWELACIIYVHALYLDICMVSLYVGVKVVLVRVLKSIFVPLGIKVGVH